MNVRPETSEHAAPRLGSDRATAAPDRPLGVRLLSWLFWFWAGATVLLVLGLLGGEGPVTVSGRAVSRTEALMGLLPVLGPMLLAVVGAALALRLGRSWARATAMLPFVLAVFGPILAGLGRASALDLVLAALVVLPVLAGLVWYLYFQPGPRAYFGARSVGDDGTG